MDCELKVMMMMMMMMMTMRIQSNSIIFHVSLYSGNGPKWACRLDLHFVRT